MKGLILETSTEKGCIILSDNGSHLASQALSDGPQLSKQLALDLDTLIKKYSFKPDFIAVGTGPGSYTGVRVGAALGQALGYGWKIPVLGFCSMEAFAPRDKKNFGVIIDARMGGLYLFTHESPAPVLIPISEAEKRLKKIKYFVSPHSETIKKRLLFDISCEETEVNKQTLSSLTYNMFLSGKYPPLTLSYLTSP